MNEDIMEKQGQVLLSLARASIAEQLGLAYRPINQLPFLKFLKQKQGMFVTLHRHGELRGCIGTIEPVKTLEEGVRENARHAAFNDTRFDPLTAGEFHEIEIEVSLLSLPEKLEYETPSELLRKLEPGVHGVIIEKGGARATFLPQVWEQLGDPRAFLGRLCHKAGLSASAWETDGPGVYTYEVRSFAE